MNEIKYGNFKKCLYYLQTNITATRINVTNDFCIHFPYVIVHAKTALSMECQKIGIKEDFDQNGSLSIS